MSSGPSHVVTDDQVERGRVAGVLGRQSSTRLTDGRWRHLAKFENLEPKRLHLRENPVYRGPVLEQAGEHGLAGLHFRSHARKCGQSGSSKPPLYPDHVVAARLCGHAMILG
jgi:hypothetical protein